MMNMDKVICIGYFVAGYKKNNDVFFEQLAHTSGNSPALSLSETDSGPVESKSSQTGATKSDLEPSVSTANTQQNIEPPYPDIAKLTAMDDTVKRKLLSSKWNDSYIQIYPHLKHERRQIPSDVNV
jgi:hypothetical protein